MERMKKDYPSFLQRFCYFPTVFWVIGNSDSTILMVNKLGIFSSAVAVLGLESSLMWSMALLVAILSLLSLDIALDLSYPWDCLLFEAGWLALFLPAPPPCWLQISVAQRPPWLLSFLFRWLLFRVVFGFGKLKFSGHSSRDNGYIKGFLIYQPIPSIFGWLGETLPVIFHKIALIGMFAIEIVAPFFLFFPAQSQENVIPWRAVASAHFIALMFGIQLCGNFGHFNVLTVGLSLPFLFETSPSTTVSMTRKMETQLCIFYMLMLLSSLCQCRSPICHLTPGLDKPGLGGQLYIRVL